VATAAKRLPSNGVAADRRAALTCVRLRGTTLAPTNAKTRRERSCKRRVAVRLASPEALQRRRGTRPLVRFCGKFGGTCALRASTRDIGETCDKRTATSAPDALAWRGYDAPSY
jgi:hypothetical protein